MAANIDPELSDFSVIKSPAGPGSVRRLGGKLMQNYGTRWQPLNGEHDDGNFYQDGIAVARPRQPTRRKLPTK